MSRERMQLELLQRYFTVQVRGMEDPENGFHFERIPDGIKRPFIPNVQGKCPQCGNPMTYIHDLKCDKCDNQFIQYCYNCGQHYRLEQDE